MFCVVTTEITVEILRKKYFSQSDSKFNNFRSHFRSYHGGFSVFPMFYLVTTEDCVEFRSITTLFFVTRRTTLSVNRKWTVTLRCELNFLETRRTVLLRCYFLTYGAIFYSYSANFMNLGHVT